MTPETYRNPPRYKEPGETHPGQWEFELPMTRPMSLNDRDHHQMKAKRTRVVRDAACMLARMAKIPKMKKCRVTLIYEPRDNRPRDAINLAATLKPVQDGLVDARVVPDDTPEYMESPMPIIDEPTPKGQNGRLTVVVERLA